MIPDDAQACASTVLPRMALCDDVGETKADVDSATGRSH